MAGGRCEVKGKRQHQADSFMQGAILTAEAQRTQRKLSLKEPGDTDSFNTSCHSLETINNKLYNYSFPNNWERNTIHADKMFLMYMANIL